MANKLSPVDPSALTLTFDDEFSSFNSSPDGSVGWMTQYPFSGAQRTLPYTHEAEYLSDSSTGVNPFSLSNGVLDITATVAAPGSNPLKLPYNSGAITTYKSFAQLYGYFEVRAELPAGQGLWPAFWMLPVNGQSGTEIDIFEVLGNSPTTLNASTHSSNSSLNTSQALQVANTSTGFHTYGVDWEPTTLTFYMDGQPIATAPTPPDMNVPMYMLLSLAVGGAGSWPGPTNASTKFPATMQIDYVRAYATPATVGTSDPHPQATVAVLPSIQAAAPSGTGSISAAVTRYSPAGAQPGVGVALLNAAGQVVATAVTDSSGNVRFGNLGAGTYQLRYLPPASLLLLPGSQADVTTGLTAQFKLGGGQGLTVIHETVFSAAHVGGTVQLAGAPQGGVTVQLLDTKQAVVATTTTDPTGAFGFYAPAGAYAIKYLPPAGEAVLIGSHASTVTSTSLPVTLVAGQSFLLSPQALVANPGTVSGTVVSGNATVAQAGVSVALISGGTTVATAVTDSLGHYSFTNVAAGSYQVSYTPPLNTVLGASGPADAVTGLVGAFAVAPGQTVSLAAETLLPAPSALSGSVLFTNGVAVGESNVTVTLLSGAGSTLATTTTDGKGAFSFAKLTAGAYQVRYTAPSGEVLQSGPGNVATGLTGTLNLTVGQTLTLGAETVAGTLGTITGTTMFGSAAQAGVTVRLLNGTGATAATTLTNGSGAYHFTALATGYYRVQYSVPAGEVIQGGPADLATGLTMSFSVTAGGTRTLGPVTLGTDPHASIGGTVALNSNGGLGSVNAAGVTVVLLNAAKTVVATATTDATGSFRFNGINAGTYQVQYAPLPNTILGAASAADPTTGLTAPVTVSPGQTLALPTETLAPAPAVLSGVVHYADGTTSAQAGVAVTLLSGNGNVVASTATDAGGAFRFTGLANGTYQVQYAPLPNTILGAASAADPTTGLTAPVTVAPGQTLALPTETLAPAPAVLSGVVQYADGTTSSQAGVAVTLLSGNGTIVAATTTDANGAFQFNGLAHGAYQVQYAALPNTILGAASAADPTTGLTAQVTVAPGQTLALPAETLAPAPAVLSGVVQYADGTTSAQAGVAVTLLSGNGNVVAGTATDANGAFRFTGLAHGIYQVQYAPLPNTILGAASAADPTTGLTAQVMVAPGQTLTLPTETLAPAFANLSGSVLYAGAGQPGVAVALRDGQGHVVASTTSDTMGAFTFTGLAPGSYALVYTAPSGEMFQVGDPADVTTGCTAPIVLTAGQNAVAAAEHLLLAPVSLTLSGSSAKLIRGDGPFIVTGSPGNSTLVLGNGDQSVTLGGFYNSATLGQGNDTVTLNGPGQKLHVGDGIETVTLNGSFDVVTLGNTPQGALSTVVANGSSEQITAGNGNVSVTASSGSNTLLLGNGNDTVTLVGSHNTVTVGTGASVIDAGTNGAIVHAGGGNVSVKVAGQNNSVDIGPGSGRIDAGVGSRMDTFALNGANQGLISIAGYNVNTGDVLDLTRTLAGTSVASDLSNIGNFITAINSNGNTTLRVDPTGGSGTPCAFATLQGVNTTVSALAAAHDFRMS